MFGMRCQENGIEHRLTKIKHPWTNGQVERMNRTIKEATVQRYYYALRKGDCLSLGPQNIRGGIIHVTCVASKTS